MECPNCGSLRVRRSLRRGLWEGLILRMMLRAPYRCFDCGTRYFGSSLIPAFRQRRRHKSLAGWLGFRGGQVRKFHRALIILALFAALIVVASWLVQHLSQPTVQTP